MLNLDPPPNTPQITWPKLKDWLYKLWQIVRGLTFGGDANTYSAAIFASSSSGDGAPSDSLNGGNNGFISSYANLRRRSINGSFNVAQLPAITVTSPVAGLYGGPDHFAASNTAGGSFTQSQSNFSFGGISRKCILQQVSSVMTNNAGSNLWSGVLQAYEGFQVFDMVGSPMSISFLFNANWSGTVTVAVRFVRGTVFCYVTTFTCVANIPRFVSITTPPVPSGVTVAPDNVYTADVWIGAANAGTFNTSTLNAWQSANAITANTYTNWCVTPSNFIAVAELQVEKGPPTTFERWEVGYEYQQCLRYLNAFGGQAPLLRGVTASTTTAGRIGMPLQVPMRAPAVIHNLVGLQVYDGVNAFAISSIAVDYSGTMMIEYDVNMGGTWGAVPRPAVLFQQVSSCYVLAELI